MAALAACLSGCPQTIRVEDDSAPFVSARAVWRPESLQQGRHRKGFEAELSQFRGKGTQDLPASEYVYLDGGLLSGPQVLSNDARIRHGHIAYNHQFNYRIPLQLEVFGGIAETDFRLRSQGSAPGTPRLSRTYRKAGVTGGVSPRWNFNRTFSAEARVTGTSDLNADFFYRSLEAALVLRLGESVMLRAGYYWVEGELNWFGAGNSEASIKLRGPSAGLTLGF